MHGEIDWGAADVKAAELRVPFAGKPPGEWVERDAAADST